MLFCSYAGKGLTYFLLVYGGLTLFLQSFGVWFYSDSYFASLSDRYEVADYLFPVVASVGSTGMLLYILSMYEEIASFVNNILQFSGRGVIKSGSLLKKLCRSMFNTIATNTSDILNYSKAKGLFLSKQGKYETFSNDVENLGDEPGPSSSLTELACQTDIQIEDDEVYYELNEYDEPDNEYYESHEHLEQQSIV